MIGLNDKTIVLSGPFGLLLQSLTARLTEYGADVAVVTDDLKVASRICQNIMDMREVSEKFGRATALQADFTNEKNVRTPSAVRLNFLAESTFILTHNFSVYLFHFIKTTSW